MTKYIVQSYIVVDVTVEAKSPEDALFIVNELIDYDINVKATPSYAAQFKVEKELDTNPVLNVDAEWSDSMGDTVFDTEYEALLENY